MVVLELINNQGVISLRAHRAVESWLKLDRGTCMTVGKFSRARAIGILLILSCNHLYGEERNLRAVMHWEGEGSLHSVGVNQILFQGIMKGIIYVENEKGDLDGAYAVCPISQKVNPETRESTATGNCEITVSSEDVVYAELDCKGVVGDCRGEFRLVEGLGRFKGISGGSDLRIRSVVGVLLKGMASGSIVRSGQGIALLPNLKVKIPQNQ